MSLRPSVPATPFRAGRVMPGSPSVRIEISEARSPSGKAKVCKTFIGGSIPPRASKAAVFSADSIPASSAALNDNTIPESRVKLPCIYIITYIIMGGGPLNLGLGRDSLLWRRELKVDGDLRVGFHFHFFLDCDRLSEEEPLGHFLAAHVECGLLARHFPAFVPGGDLILPGRHIRQAEFAMFVRHRIIGVANHQNDSIHP